MRLNSEMRYFFEQYLMFIMYGCVVLYEYLIGSNVICKVEKSVSVTAKLISFDI